MKKLLLSLLLFVGIGISANAQSEVVAVSKAIEECAKLTGKSIDVVVKMVEYHCYEISSVDGNKSFTVYVSSFKQAQTLSDIYCSKGYKNLRVKQIGSPEITGSIDRQNAKLRNNGCGR